MPRAYDVKGAYERWLQNILNIYVSTSVIIRMMSMVSEMIGVTSCPPPYPCVRGTKIADPDDCRRYYQCDRSPSGENKWELQRCQAGWRFDYILLMCRSAAEDVRCHRKCDGQFMTNLF